MKERYVVAGLEYIAESAHRISETSLNMALETRNKFIGRN